MALEKKEDNNGGGNSKFFPHKKQVADKNLVDFVEEHRKGAGIHLQYILAILPTPPLANEQINPPLSNEEQELLALHRSLQNQNSQLFRWRQEAWEEFHYTHIFHEDIPADYTAAIIKESSRIELEQIEDYLLFAPVKQWEGRDVKWQGRDVGKLNLCFADFLSANERVYLGRLLQSCIDRIDQNLQELEQGNSDFAMKFRHMRNCTRFATCLGIIVSGGAFYSGYVLKDPLMMSITILFASAAWVAVAALRNNSFYAKICKLVSDSEACRDDYIRLRGRINIHNQLLDSNSNTAHSRIKDLVESSQEPAEVEEQKQLPANAALDQFADDGEPQEAQEIKLGR